ncbi:MAG: enoyl-CoA hydratase-related protein [Myxococcota bacterium]|nr:enoyl-CoA hydratase-related protein [Myxococcota bacterium]
MSVVLTTISGPVATVTVNRPEALNAINGAVLDGLEAAFAEVEANPVVRAAVLTGAGGKAFVAGADIKEMQAFGAEDARAFSARGHSVFARMESSRLVWIAAVEGFCLGGGCELAMAADWINASAKSRFGQPEVNLGLIPGFGGTIRLARRVGQAKAIELCVTAEMVRGDEAKALGLVNNLYEPGTVLEASQAQAQLIAGKGPLAVANAKRVIRSGADLPQERGNALEQQAFGIQFGTVDGKEGMVAFSAKRSAEFVGK